MSGTARPATRTADWTLSVDLWGTLLTYGDRDAEAAWRITEFHRELVQAGHDLTTDQVGEAIRTARDRMLAEQRSTGLQMPIDDQVRTLLAALRVDDPAPDLLEALTVIHTHAVLRACPDVIAGAHAALREARAAGATIILNSNTLATPAEVTRTLLDRHELTALLDGCVFSGEVGFAKPRREMFAAVAAAAGTPLHRVVHVGNDWKTDVQGALAAGCHAVWFNPKGKPPRPGAPAITSLTQMTEVARTILAGNVMAATALSSRQPSAAAETEQQ